MYRLRIGTGPIRVRVRVRVWVRIRVRVTVMVTVTARSRTGPRAGWHSELYSLGIGIEARQSRTGGTNQSMPSSPTC